MRYYLVSFVDNNFRQQWRDARQRLAGFQRNLQFRELDNLYFTYKYLGEDLGADELHGIQAGLSKYIESANIRKFVYPLQALRVGRKAGELSVNEVAIALKPSAELQQFFRLINNKVVALSPDVVRRKDHNRLLGKIKLAQIRPNTAVRDQQQIAEILKTVELPKELEVGSLGIIGLEIYNNKPKLRQVAELKLR